MRRLLATLCGARDGRHLIPHGDAPSPWVLGCWARHEIQVQRIAMARTRTESRLGARRDALGLAAAQAGGRLRKAEALESRTAEQREALLLQARQLLAEQGNPMGHGLPTWGYALAVTALCSLEFPLVYLSFTTFGLDPVYTFLLAALCAALTGFLGHAAGTLSRHLRISVRPVLVLLLLGSVAFVASLAYLRESAMAALTSDSLTLNPVAAAWALFAISCATMVAAALLAWHHRVEPLGPEIARATRALKRAGRGAGKARSSLLRINRQESKVSHELKAAATLAAQRQKASESRSRELIAIYTAANLRARGDNQLPTGLR